MYIVPQLRLLTETGKEKVQQDLHDFAEIVEQVIGEEGYCTSRKLLARLHYKRHTKES